MGFGEMRLIAASTAGALAADPASTTTTPSSPTCTPTFAPRAGDHEERGANLQDFQAVRRRRGGLRRRGLQRFEATSRSQDEDRADTEEGSSPTARAPRWQCDRHNSPCGKRRLAHNVGRAGTAGKAGKAGRQEGRKAMGRKAEGQEPRPDLRRSRGSFTSVDVTPFLPILPLPPVLPVFLYPAFDFVGRSQCRLSGRRLVGQA